MRMSFGILVVLTALFTDQGLADEPLPSDSVESIRVHQVIDAMEKAVQETDVGAYMALIDPEDSFFIIEQRAWISDLIKHPVEDIQIDIAWNEPVIGQGDGSVIAPIEIAWHVEGEELDRHFAYQARFEPVGAIDGQWVFVGRAWGFADTAIPGIRVYSETQHEELAYLCSDRAGILRETIADNFQKSKAPKDANEIVIKIYPDMASLQASIYLSYTDSLAGWNEPGESIKILGRENDSQKRIDRLLGHEIGHAVSFEFGPEINKAPWWTLEGIAEVASDLFAPNWDEKTHRLSDLAKEDNLRDWEVLSDFRGEAANHGRYVYLQGWSMIDYIGRIYQLPARNEWFTHLGAGKTVDEASLLALDISFEELDAQWNQWLINWKPSQAYQAKLDERARKAELRKAEREAEREKKAQESETDSDDSD